MRKNRGTAAVDCELHPAAAPVRALVDGISSRHPGAWRTLRGLVLVLAALELTLQDVAARVDDRQSSSSRLVDLVVAIESAGLEVQADFAAIALDAMIEAYEREYDVVAEPTRRFSVREESKQRRWGVAVRRFLDDIYQAREAVLGGARVQLIAESPMDVQLLVEGRLVAVSSPQIGQSEEFEGAVVKTFCARYPCEPALRGRAAEPRRPLGGNWSVSQGNEPAYETVDGLRFVFTNLRNRVEKQALCQRAAGELRMVLEVLRNAQARGDDIAWRSMSVIRDTDGERLIVTRSGRGARHTLPILLRSPAVLLLAQPWLEARLHGRAAEQNFPGAERLFGRLLADG